ncbi:hypothetical protein M405DRAFT_929559 [Rhizopogon salebrosus TDB-379]|nr:hypothetical protein M405DRAFT_929559 [Rhizopogon salebrosus TDB-379]
MTRCLASLADDQGYAIRSVEGSIGIGFSVPSPEVHDKRYAFKCRRQTIDDMDHVWLVNASAFQPVHDTFTSVSSPRTVSILDYKVK